MKLISPDGNRVIEAHGVVADYWRREGYAEGGAVTPEPVYVVEGGVSLVVPEVSLPKDEAEPEPAISDLRGHALTETLEAAGLPTSGTVAEKQQRLIDLATKPAEDKGE